MDPTAQPDELAQTVRDKTIEAARSPTRSKHDESPARFTPIASSTHRDTAANAGPVTSTPKTAPATTTATEADNSPDDTVNTSTTTSARRNAGGNASNVYSGNKIRHLKKDDGIPLWRKDIQYDFLRLVFSDNNRCFTKYSEKKRGFTFAEIYIDAMAKSSKCSKILKEKLLQDTEGAISMAMVCLLVNLGRMNTTLNFFPEMRAQLRTYHSIPALQAHQDPSAYKQLQDAPRLKSILKGATEDSPQPSTIEEIRAVRAPRTNAVNLIFVMAQSAPKVTELHFEGQQEFHDLIMSNTLSSEDRARAFLWLIWWYLESENFDAEDMEQNPYGSGQMLKDSSKWPPVIKVPTIQSLTEEQALLENVDTEEEMRFGETKRKERILILASEPSPAMTALKRARKEKGLTSGNTGYRSDDDASETGGWKGGDGKALASSVAARSFAHTFDTDSVRTRSPSPPPGSHNGQRESGLQREMRIDNLLNSEDTPADGSPAATASHAAPAAPAPVKKGPGRGNWRRNKPKPDPAAPSLARTASGEPSHHVPLLPSTSAFPGDTGNNLPETPDANSYSAYSSFPVQGASPTHAGGSASFHASALPDHVPTPSYQAQKRHRGVTQHQSALISHRRAQIDYTLDRRIRHLHITARSARNDEGAIFRAWKRIRLLPPDYDSEEEQIRVRKTRDRADKDDDSRVTRRDAEDVEIGGRRPRVTMAGFTRLGERGEGDVGEEMRNVACALRRAGRRLERWQDHDTPGTAMIRRREWASGKRRKRDKARQESQADDIEAEEDSDEINDVPQPASPGYASGERQRRRFARASDWDD